MGLLCFLPRPGRGAAPGKTFSHQTQHRELTAVYPGMASAEPPAEKLF